jgi:hypothetical protein
MAAKTRKLEPITIAELELRRAQLTEKAARLRERQAATVSTSPACLALGREVRAVQQRAEDYGRILEALRLAELA